MELQPFKKRILDFLLLFPQHHFSSFRHGEGYDVGRLKGDFAGFGNIFCFYVLFFNGQL